ncbi:MAG: NADH-quinone oxidoreductase subunit A [Myxococcota bacterium]|nr:NADH-quinone oxidoreductase subunit A [Myxococcota bacterium]
MQPSPLTPYLPLAMVLLLAGLLAWVIVFLASILGPKRMSSVKAMSFEAGSEPLGDARGRFAVKFYVVALLFIVFDVEAVFLYPWAVNFKFLGWFGYMEMLVFAATLVAALIYVWKKGALDWEN